MEVSHAKKVQSAAVYLMNFKQTWVQVHWYLYLSTISTALLSTCKVFKYFLLKVTCTCTESLSQVLKVLNLSTSSVLKYHSMYLRKYLSTS